MTSLFYVKDFVYFSTDTVFRESPSKNVLFIIIEVQLTYHIIFISGVHHSDLIFVCIVK